MKPTLNYLAVSSESKDVEFPQGLLWGELGLLAACVLAFAFAAWPAIAIVHNAKKAWVTGNK